VDCPNASQSVGEDNKRTRYCVGAAYYSALAVDCMTADARVVHRVYLPTTYLNVRAASTLLLGGATHVHWRKLQGT
jgi:hypothetical protein